MTARARATAPPARPRRVRLYEQVRTAHLERARQHTPATLLYSARRYDFDDSLVAGLDVAQAGTAAAALFVLRHGVRELEINEPLQRSGLARSLVVALAVRLGGLVRRQPTRVVTYAIENLDPWSRQTLPSPVSTRTRARRALDRLLSLLVARQVDRIAYGTAAARDLYAATRGRQLRGAESRLTPAISAPCDCPPAEREPRTVLYLGAFEERKGVRRLLAAWPEIVAADPRARLTLVGKGPLLDEVEQFAAQADSVEVVVDPPRAQIHRLLRRSAVLVLLSQPRPRWREQVGLPLVEGLAHGCRIVATDETGIADWLRSHRHHVVRAGAAGAEITAIVTAIRAAVGADRSADDVLADLPDEDGRAAADRWLFAE
ncbi:glycosyltransferase family 4 protein [uncultured Jatrophihabitans sp.]|uniref:glycosyltransferase family 4 protein n=1 Tax=uncultured Jatrophihabitans sp. TaxID=1610747 RepID=UPI0035CA022B